MTFWKLEQKWTNGKWLRAEKAEFQAEIERRWEPIYFTPQNFQKWAVSGNNRTEGKESRGLI